MGSQRESRAVGPLSAGTEGPKDPSRAEGAGGERAERPSKPAEHHHHPLHDMSEVGEKPLSVAVILNVGLTLFEALVGVYAGSLALIADALHNLGDAAALVIALVARRVARRGADERYTFGYRRAELIGALVNLTTLLVLGVYLVAEAFERIWSPQPIHAGWVMMAAGVAVVVDVATALFLRKMAEGSLNVRAAFVHNVTDALTSVAVIVGAALVAATGRTFLDPLLTFFIAGGVLYTSARMLQKTAHILMEGTPPDLDLDALVAQLSEVEDVLRIHHVHAWQLDETHRAVEAHVVLDEGVLGERLEGVRLELRRILNEGFSVGHATLEFEWPGSTCGDEHRPGPNCHVPCGEKL